MALPLPPLDSLFAGGRVIHAVKVAVAAGLSWLVVLPWGGAADTYRYYAPLGAVVVVASTVTGSLRQALSSVGAMVVGAALAVLALALPMPEGIGLTAVVLIGSWVAYDGRLGPMASWVPISALFVLVIGQDDPFGFLTAYIGLVVVGALVGLVVNMLWPTLPLGATQASLDRLRDTLAAQLDDLAEGLSTEPRPTAEQWREGQRAIDSRAEEMHHMVGEAREARRVNWRARGRRDLAARQYRQARALAQLSFLVEEAFDLVTRGEQAEADTSALGPDLRPGAAAALHSTADVLAAVEDDTVDPEIWHAAKQATEDFARELRERQFQSEDEFFVAGSLVTTLRRVVHSVEPSS